MWDNELLECASEYECGRVARLEGHDKDSSRSSYWLLGWSDDDLIIEDGPDLNIWRVEREQ